MTSTPGTEPAPPADPLLDPVDRMVELVTRSVEEWTTAAKSSLDRALAGGYGADALASDLSGAVARGVRDWARAVSAVSSIVTVVSNAPLPEDLEPGAAAAAAAEPPPATPPPVSGAPPPEGAGGASAEGAGS